MWGLRGPATFSGPRCRFRRIGTVAASPSSRLRCHRSFNCGLECGLIGDQMSQRADITALFGSHWCLHREPNLKTVPGLHKRWRISRPISGPLSGERMARMARFENSAPLAHDGSPPDIARMLPPLRGSSTEVRLNFATAWPRSVSTHFMQMIAGKMTLARPHARQNFGRLANVTPFVDLAIPTRCFKRPATDALRRELHTLAN